MTRVIVPLVFVACSARATSPLTNVQLGEDPAREYTAHLRMEPESYGDEAVSIQLAGNRAKWIIDDQLQMPWYELEGFVAVRGTCYEAAGGTHLRVESMRLTSRREGHRFQRIGPERLLHGSFHGGRFVGDGTTYRLVNGSKTTGRGWVAVVARELEPDTARANDGRWLWVIAVHPYDFEQRVPRPVPCPPIPSP